MSVRKKALVILSITFAGLMLALYLSFTAIVGDSFTSLERREAEVNTKRAISALEEFIADIDGTVREATRFSNMTHYHPATRDPEIPQDLYATMLTARINLIVIVDSQGTVIFDQAVDLVSGRPTLVPAEIAERFTDGVLLRPEDMSGGLQGVMIIPEGPTLVAAHPILATRGGPVGGTMIMGRFLDDREVDALAKLTQLTLTILPMDDPEFPPDTRTALISASLERPVEVVPVSSEIVAGYSLIRDVNGKPAFSIRTDSPRQIHARGQSTMRYLLLAFLGFGLVFGVIAVLLFHKLILSRLSDLSAAVKRIADSRDLAARVPQAGSDEVSTVAREINSMMESLEETQGAREILQQQLLQQTAAIDTAIDGMAILDPEGKFRYMNNALAKMYGYDGSEDLTGKKWEILYGEEELRKFDQEIMPLVTREGMWRGEAVGKKKDGSQFLQEISIYTTPDGGLVCVDRDLTERKEAAEELRLMRRRLLVAQETERRHISRELHDEIGQDLTAVGLVLDRMPRLSEEGRESAAEDVRKLLSDLMTKVRDLSASLLPSILVDFGLILPWYRSLKLRATGVS